MEIYKRISFFRKKNKSGGRERHKEQDKLVIQGVEFCSKSEVTLSLVRGASLSFFLVWGEF